MLTIYPLRWSGRLWRLLFDVLVVLWTAAWVLAGWSVYQLVAGLQVVADAISRTGTTFDTWAAAFENAVPGGIPGLSDAMRGLAATLRRSAGEPLIQRGMQAHDAIQHLAIATGLFTALLPIVTATGLYLVWRWRDVRELTAAVDFVLAAERSGRVREANAILAHRAVALLPFRQLMRASPDPVGDLAAGRHEALAAAMLRRAGTRPLVDGGSTSPDDR
ncbi:MAG: hypothetical protein E6J41_08770 [Chloroflexi bacterium]|nr:MAG: hypothetical protein E6J41_08770 [Chloroflexota bacterium]